uniref:J domain-containing protein n=1 Tax=viral metagenome TaxID=1070528 RepID=A0A6C0ELW4_9ZZZZ
MNKVDLNIDNYSYEDILELFHLDYNFDINELKSAKKIVLKTHPDKSKLPKEYFLFYSKAYKMLYYVYEFRLKSKKNEHDEYENMKNEKSEANTELINQMNKKEKFNSWFNRLFEKYYDKDDNGYGEWLSEEETKNTPKMNNMREMNEYIEAKKQSLSNEQSLIKQDYIQNIPSECSNLLNQDNEQYSSGNIFSKFQYEDLKKAHEETLIPVSQNLLESRHQYKNTGELVRERKNNIDLLSEQESNDILQNKTTKDNEISSNRAFSLIKQEEESKKRNNLFWGQLKMLENKK